MSLLNEWLSLVLLLFSFTLLAATPSVFATDPWSGRWRGVLDSPGGELPFGLEISQGGDGWTANVINGEERLSFSHVEIEESSDPATIELRWDWYDSGLVAMLSDDRRSMSGTWTKTSTAGKQSSLPFRATKGYDRRFNGKDEDLQRPAANFAGQWRVTFTDDGGEDVALGEFQQTGERVTGTFLTPTGDYRFLDGNVQGRDLRLSTFDGGHAFLFHASFPSLADESKGDSQDNSQDTTKDNSNRGSADGDSITGHFWSRDVYHATWKAHRIDQAAALKLTPDQWKVVTPTREDRRFRFAFPDVNGKVVSSDDERFRNKAIVINIFGTWCPNCNDEAPLLAKWHREFAADGLEVVGLAFELSGEFARDAEIVRRFQNKYSIEYPVLIAGEIDKSKASQALPDISAIIAYPQTILIGRDGRIAHIHTGFTGPGTGSRFQRLVEEMETRIRDLIHH